MDSKLYVMDKIRQRTALIALGQLCIGNTQGDVLYIGSDVEVIRAYCGRMTSTGRMMYSFAETAHEYQTLQRYVSAKHQIEINPKSERRYSVIIIDHRFNHTLHELLQRCDVVVSNVPFRNETAQSLLRVTSGDGHYITAYSNTKQLNKSAGTSIEAGGITFNLF